MVNHSYNTIATNKIQMPSQYFVVDTKASSYSEGNGYTCSSDRYLSQCCSTSLGSHTQRRAISTNSPVIWPWESNRFSKRENSISRGPAARLIIREGEKNKKAPQLQAPIHIQNIHNPDVLMALENPGGISGSKEKKNAELSVPLRIQEILAADTPV